jgi:hypothetical protein
MWVSLRGRSGSFELVFEAALGKEWDYAVCFERESYESRVYELDAFLMPVY